MEIEQEEDPQNRVQQLNGRTYEGRLPKVKKAPSEGEKMRTAHAKIATTVETVETVEDDAHKHMW